MRDAVRIDLQPLDDGETVALVGGLYVWWVRLLGRTLTSPLTTSPRSTARASGHACAAIASPARGQLHQLGQLRRP